MSYTVDDTTQASSPGQLSISRKKYLDYYGLSGSKRIKYHLLLSLPKKWLFKFFYSDIFVFDFILKSEHFLYGCLNPSIVINKDKGLIATFTNLTSYGEDSTPVIKISEERLDLIENLDVRNGQKLPTVALYFRNEEDPYATAWADFDPKVANCFTNDLAACNRLLARLSSHSWQCLADGLSQVENLEEVGLYHIELDEALLSSAY